MTTPEGEAAQRRLDVAWEAWLDEQSGDAGTNHELAEALAGVIRTALGEAIDDDEGKH